MGLAPRPDCIRRRRGFGARTLADQSLAGAVPHPSDRCLAGRRRGRTARRIAERVRGRLVVRLRLLPGRTLLDRPCLPGRRQDVRLDAAVCGDRRSRRPRIVHRIRPRLRARDMDARPGAHPVAGDRAHRLRMAARAFVHRISLEHLRLRADRSAGAGANRRADRNLGAHIHRRCGVRDTGAVRRRPRRHAPALAAAARGRHAAVRACRLWHVAAGAKPDAARQRRAAADHAAEPAAGREVQLRRAPRRDEALHRAVRPFDRTAVDRRARRHALDLAGIGVPVFPDARSRGAFADRRSYCRRALC